MKTFKRRLNKDEIKKIKTLRKNGLSYQRIARIIGVNYFTVVYHLNKKFKEGVINRARKRKTKKDPEYMREYMKNRYHTDEKFREKKKKKQREYWRKKHKQK